ncbi:MAG: hypothetical protein L0Y72_00205 [Gemmataceae bacterium]|nr:hypothetical protein [Gemmataceae bacterium]MCI0737431.1 hypothetical protein [Gemmataceae bacterium]
MSNTQPILNRETQLPRSHWGWLLATAWLIYLVSFVLPVDRDFLGWAAAWGSLLLVIESPERCWYYGILVAANLPVLLSLLLLHKGRRQRFASALLPLSVLGLLAAGSAILVFRPAIGLGIGYFSWLVSLAFLVIATEAARG